MSSRYSAGCPPEKYAWRVIVSVLVVLVLAPGNKPRKWWSRWDPWVHGLRRACAPCWSTCDRAPKKSSFPSIFFATLDRPGAALGWAAAGICLGVAALPRDLAENVGDTSAHALLHLRHPHAIQRVRDNNTSGRGTPWHVHHVPGAPSVGIAKTNQTGLRGNTAARRHGGCV